MKTKQVKAILVSDVHLSQKAPAARSVEPDWFEAQARQLDELKGLKKKYNAPVVIAGDVFDKWNSPPELINFAINHLPPCIAVPGQHDLPNHRYEEIHRSAYWTLVEAGIIHNLEYGKPEVAGDVTLHGFPWEHEIVPCEKTDDNLNLAVIHAYIYTNRSNSYEGAPEDRKIGGYSKKLKGYDAAVFGDNHISLYINKPGFSLINNGSFFRRTSTEFTHRPMVGLLMNDGSISPHYLDTSDDVFYEEHLDKLAREKTAIDVSGFVEGIKKLSGDSLDFRQTLKQVMDSMKVSREVRAIVIDTLND